MTKCTFLGLITTAALTFPVAATPLGLTLLDSPDVFSGFIDVRYDADADSFTAAGFALTLENPAGSLSPITLGSFALEATIDDSGSALDGALSIGGTVGGFGPSLITATLTGFGFQDPPGGEIFEFLFSINSGDLAPLFGGTGGTIGVILNAGSTGFSGSFASSFNNLVGGASGTGTGVADTAPIPEPATLVLLGLMIPLMARRVR